jgi:hypothetical protein
MELDLYNELTGANNYTMNMVNTHEGMQLSCSEFFTEVQQIF